MVVVVEVEHRRDLTSMNPFLIWKWTRCLPKLIRVSGETLSGKKTVITSIYWVTQYLRAISILSYLVTQG